MVFQWAQLKYSSIYMWCYHFRCTTLNAWHKLPSVKPNIVGHPIPSTSCHLTLLRDELGWDFVNTVSKAQISISAFYDLISEKYNFSHAKSMSHQTFTDWIFSWLSQFIIDLRNACVDCQYRLNVLACDATKLGVFFKNVYVFPVETPTKPDIYALQHTRSSRQFFLWYSWFWKHDNRKKKVCKILFCQGMCYGKC